jgi:hypothetical protein
MTYKYGSDFETAVLANANCGGENVARGARKERGPKEEILRERIQRFRNFQEKP